MTKMYIKFNNHGIPVNVINEETYIQVCKTRPEMKFDWSCYTPEIKYRIPWLNEAISADGKWKTLEEVILDYCAHIVKITKYKEEAARALDIDRKTLYRYLKAIENDKWLKGHRGDDQQEV